jgi:hypothetical protein
MSDLRLTDLTQATGITINDLLHIVIPTDISQDPAGSSYKASVEQLYDGLSGYCVPDLYVSNLHSCSPLNINPLDEGGVYFGSTSGITLDVTNKRIGINTSTPQYALDIKGSQSNLYYDPTSVGGNFVVSGSTGIPRMGMTIPAYLTKPTAGFNLGMRAWDDVTFTGYGKVGDAFFYAGNQTNGFNILNPVGTGTEDYIRFYAGQTANGTTSDIHIQGSGSTRGYVGIGTELPTEKLHISGGDMLVENTNGKYYTDIQNATGPLTILSGDSSGVSRIGVIVPTYDSITLGIRGASAVFPGYGKQGDAFIYSSNANNGFNLISSPGTGTDDYIRFYAGQTANGTTSDIHIQGSGSTRGYVGIGTEYPTEKLHVSGNTKIDGLTQTSGITSTGGVTFKQVTINSTYSATTQDYMIDVTGGTFTVYLPSAVGIQGRLLVVKNNGGGAVTVQPTLGQNIDDKPFVILGETNTIQLASNGSNWVAISYNISTVNSSTGVFEFTGLSIASTTTFNVAPVKGWIVNDTTNPLSPQLYYVEYSGGTHTATYVTTATETWVYLTSGGTISQSNIELTEQQRRENIFLGKLGHANKTNIINAFSQPDFVLSPLSQLRDMFAPIGLINQGIYASANGSNLSFNTSAGYLHGLGINFAINTLSPNEIYVSGTSPCTFQYRTQTGGTASNTTFIDPTKWDVGGVVTSITGTKATNQRIYLVQNGIFRVQYGQTEYNQLTAAIEGIATEQFNTFSNFTNNGILIGVLSVLSTATNLSDTSKARFFFTSKFGETVGAAGGISTTTLQQAYNNSVTPEITTNSTLGPLSVKNGAGTADNVTNVFEGVNSGGTTTSFVRADGTISGTSISATTFNLAGSQIESAWTSYVPVWTASGTNPVINNGTIEGWYKVIGKTCFVRGNIAMGSTTTFGTGEWYVSMPLTAAHADAILLNGNLLDNGTAWYNVTVNGARSGFNTKAPIQYVNIVNGTASDVNPTQPFTWTDGDRFIWNGSYEIA